MLAISLMRMGAKGNPYYRLVVKEKRSKRDGKYIENLGTYDPMLDPAEVVLKHDRIQYWIGVGAQPTETVKSLIKNNPVQTEEERAAAQAVREEKKAAAEAERAAAQQAEAEKVVAELASEPEAAANEAPEAQTAEAAPVEAVETSEAEAALDTEAVAETTEAAPEEAEAAAE